MGEGGGEKEEAEGGEAANKEMTPVRALFEAVKGCMVSSARPDCTCMQLHVHCSIMPCLNVGCYYSSLYST